ncbi:MAG: aminopeptidase P family protein [Chloroflexi bacterium]|nr:aminopeptidase P family protein [Chloroflexota bacterium]
MAIASTSIKIDRAEFSTRAEQLKGYIQQEKLSGVALFDNYHILYYSGFAFIPTERPIAWMMNAKGEQGMFVPRLELEHAKANVQGGRVDNYLEYPDNPHPMTLFKQMLAEMGFGGRVGADNDGYPWILGYRGPALTEMLGCTYVNVNPFVEDMMALKSPAELALIRESVKWGHLAHVLLQRYTKVGVTETEVSLRAGNEATLAMMDTIGPIYRALGYGRSGPSAGYRGQIGRNAAIPHALANNIVFQAGDVLVTGAGCPMWGYQSELERTMIIGAPSDDQRLFFDHMLQAQQTALNAMKPGVKCSDVDRAVRKFYEDNDLKPYWKHHSGHAIGLRYHEGPFLDIGDDTVLREGMVFTVEPGLYAPELGGYRHSDTVAITAGGIEMMTYYPRDLESLTIAG